MSTTDERQEVAIIPAIARTLKTLSDGTVRLNIDVEPSYRETAMRLFGEPGTGIAVARLSLDATQRQLRQETIAPYRQAAKSLRLSSFFRMPEVWRLIGTDAEFLAWVRLQKCAYCHAAPNEHKPTEAAHVRRVAEGAGVAIKPEYCAIPLCHNHHALQHAQGESALGGKEWFDKKRIEILTQWAWESLRQQLGYESWAEIPPVTLRMWAVVRSVHTYLPSEYRDEN
jgi:hypothetical protein